MLNFGDDGLKFRLRPSLEFSGRWSYQFRDDGLEFRDDGFEINSKVGLCDRTFDQ